MMERPTQKQRSMFLKLLPKPANSAMNFQSSTAAPFSPGRDHHRSSTNFKGFSGPINFANLPEEAKIRRQEIDEPGSPKVSCMGQIKSKHKRNKAKNKNKKSKSPPLKSLSLPNQDDRDRDRVRRTGSVITRLFSRSTVKKKRSDEDHDQDRGVAALDNSDNNIGNDDKVKVVPYLGQMKKFASGRESLADFDWKAQIPAVDHDRDYYSDGEGARPRLGDHHHHDLDHDHDDHDGRRDQTREIIIPYSAPMMLGGGGAGLGLELEPRKEINLWKRRTMAPPPPLSLSNS